MYAIDALSGQFQFGTDGPTYSGWAPYDDTTRNMLRDGGWTEYDGYGSITRIYAGFVGLGSINSGAQPYYQLTTTDTPHNFPFADQFNVGVRVYGDANNGDFDTRVYAKTFVREQGKKYKDSILSDTGKTATGAYVVNFLISNEDDLKVTAADSSMTNAPYSGITVSYYSTDQSVSIGGSSYPFRIIIEGNGATLEQIYTKCQYLLRQGTNINQSGDAGSVIGKTASLLCSFVGDTLVTGTGVFIQNFSANDTNRVEFYDKNGVKRTYPYVAAGNLVFNSFLTSNGGGYYRLFYSTLPGAGNDWGESGAVTVNDSSGNPIQGTITSGSIAFTFDYDNNTQGGRTAGTDATVVLVAGNPGYAKPVVVNATITRAKGITISATAEFDRVYG